MTRPPSPSMVTFTPGSSTSTTSVPSGVKMRITVARRLVTPVASVSEKPATKHRRMAAATARRRRGGRAWDRPPPPGPPPPGGEGSRGYRWMLDVGQVPAQQFGDFGCRLIALGRILGVQFVDDRDQPVGD